MPASQQRPLTTTLDTGQTHKALDTHSKCGTPAHPFDTVSSRRDLNLSGSLWGGTCMRNLRLSVATLVCAVALLPRPVRGQPPAANAGKTPQAIPNGCDFPGDETTLLNL